ncbi:MAG: chloride channel protein, partial [Janthinobacterium lividum]
MSSPPLRLSKRTWRRAHYLWHEYGIIWLGAIVVGLIAVFYARLIDYGFSLFSAVQSQYFWAPLLISPAAGALSVWLTRRFFRGAEGSGIPQVIAMLHSDATLGRTLLTLRIVVGKIGISFLAILGGFTIGREGPTVQVGAALMYQLRRFYKPAGAALERQLALAGAAAGLSAAFNTPLAGIVFAIEELTRSFEQRASGVVITAIIFAGIVALGVNGNYTYFGTIEVRPDFPGILLVAVVVTAVVTGIAGGGFCWLIINSARWLPARVSALRAERPVLFAAACGLAIAAIGLVAGTHTFGSGYAEARGVLDGRESMSLAYPFLKMASMVGSYLPGIPGGIFAPSLAIGAGFGNLLHEIFGSLSIPMLIALGMVGYLAAVTQAPITAFVIVMEMINGHALVISLMATSLIAARVSRLFAPPFYETLARRYVPASGGGNGSGGGSGGGNDVAGRSSATPPPVATGVTVMPA